MPDVNNSETPPTSADELDSIKTAVTELAADIVVVAKTLVEILNRLAAFGESRGAAQP